MAARKSAGDAGLVRIVSGAGIHGQPSPLRELLEVGIADAYHLWWDAQLGTDIGRAAGRIVSYQLSDWILPLPQDTLLGRGHIGDGHIDFGPISAQVLAAGYVEVEIFSQQVWAAPPDEAAATVCRPFAALPDAPGAGATGRRQAEDGRPARPVSPARTSP